MTRDKTLILIELSRIRYIIALHGGRTIYTGGALRKRLPTPLRRGRKSTLRLRTSANARWYRRFINSISLYTERCTKNVYIFYGNTYTRSKSFSFLIYLQVIETLEVFSCPVHAFFPTTFPLLEAVLESPVCEFPFGGVFSFVSKNKVHWGHVERTRSAMRTRKSQNNNDERAGTLSWCRNRAFFFHISNIFFVTFSRLTLIVSRNTISMNLTFDLTWRAAFGLDENLPNHCGDRNFVSTS